MLRLIASRALPHSLVQSTRRFASTHVKIVEVSPRDGLQNEGRIVPTATKLELIRRLVDAGAYCVEAGAFVSPKWVPQMADTPEILMQLEPRKGVSYPFLVPNDRGLSSLLKLIAPEAAAHGRTDEIAIFTAATDGFSKANTNVSVAEGLARLEGVARAALEAGLRVRGYVSVVAGCPYEGSVEPRRVADVAKALLDMGVYEVSLGDTVGQGTPTSMRAVLDECTKYAPADKFAAHCHDTFGTGLANVMAMVEMGVRTVDTSVAGLGGCPYSPGATGNIDTESVVRALHASGYSTGLDLDKLARIGAWISQELQRPNGSSAGRAILARAAAAAAKEHKAKL